MMTLAVEKAVEMVTVLAGPAGEVMEMDMLPGMDTVWVEVMDETKTKRLDAIVR